MSTITPGKPVERDPAEMRNPEAFNDFYVLHCKQKVGVTELNFKCSQGRREAINLARAYCNYYGFTFMRVEPFLTDINVPINGSTL